MLFKDEAPLSVLDPYQFPYSKEFNEIIKYYDHVSDYEKIL
jgi:hypothetical protein